MKNSDIGTGSWRFSINGSRNNWIFCSMSLGVISTLCLSELCENRAGKAPEDPQGENWGTFCFLLTRARHHSLVWIPWRFPCCCEPVLPNLPPHSSNVNRKSPDTRSECLEKLIYFQSLSMSRARPKQLRGNSWKSSAWFYVRSCFMFSLISH